MTDLAKPNQLQVADVEECDVEGITEPDDGEWPVCFLCRENLVLSIGTTTSSGPDMGTCQCGIWKFRWIGGEAAPMKPDARVIAEHPHGRMRLGRTIAKAVNSFKMNGQHFGDQT